MGWGRWLFSSIPVLVAGDTGSRRSCVRTTSKALERAGCFHSHGREVLEMLLAAYYVYWGAETLFGFGACALEFVEDTIEWDICCSACTFLLFYIHTCSIYSEINLHRQSIFFQQEALRCKKEPPERRASRLEMSLGRYHGEHRTLRLTTLMG